MARAGSGKRTISVVSTIVSICLVLFLYGLLGLFLLKATELKKVLKESIELKIMFRADITEPQIMKWQSLLSQREYVKTARFISKDEALDMVSYGEDAKELLGINPLPHSIELNVHEYFANQDSLSHLRAELESKDDIIREVVYSDDLVSGIDKNIKRVTIAMSVFVFVFLLIAIALINSTIRLTIYSRRFLVKSMQLVGATRSFIRRPFILQSIINGLLSGMLAVGLLLGLLYLVQHYWPLLINIQDIPGVSLLFASVLALGFIISWISSYFAINRYLDLRLEELY